MGKGGWCFLIPIALLGLLALAAMGLGDLGPQYADPGKGEYIRMIQPNGWQPSRDSQYAEHVNEPNSRANENNFEAVKNQAEAAKLYAQATAIVEQAHRDTGQAQSSGVRTGFGAGAMLVCLPAGLLIFVLVVGLVSKGEKD